MPFPSNLVAYQDKFKEQKNFQTQQGKIYSIGNQINSRHSNKQENANHHKKIQFIEINPEMIQMIR